MSSPNLLHQTGLAATLLITNLIIILYDPSHAIAQHPAPPPTLPAPISNILSTIRALLTNTSLPGTSTLIDPSPVLFCLAVLAYFFAAFSIYGLRAHDRWQDHILTLFNVPAIILSWYTSGPRMEGLKSILQLTLPTAFTAGLLSSAVVHWVLKPWSAGGYADVEEQDEKTKDNLSALGWLRKEELRRPQV